MSSISVDAITDINGGNTTSINGTTPNAYNTVGKNRIINGNMMIDQRNSGAAVTTSGSFPVDRFSVLNATDGAFSSQQDTSVPVGFINSLKFTTTTADASLGATQYARCHQRIEGLNCADLGWGTVNAKTVTLSFWVRSSLTGTFGGALTNSAFDRSYPFTYTISSADTWEQKAITITGDTSGTWLTTNGLGIQVIWGLGVGSTYSGTADSWAGAGYLSATGAVSVIGTLNATWYITGVQLEVGESSTEFEHRPYGTELQLCQRYYWKNGNYAGYAFLAVGMDQGTAGEFLVTFPVQMRASPTASISGCRFRYNGGGNTGVSIIANYASTLSTDLNLSGCNASTGVIVFLQTFGNASDYLAFDAEL